MQPSPSSHTTAEQRAKLQGWFAGQIPDGWFTTAPEVTFDNDEILVVGTLKAPQVGAEAAPEVAAEAASARIERFREDTREQRMRIAEDAQRRFRRRVSWGAACGELTRHFTTASAPVMTRLRMPERAVLDTLIDAGVARSRSDALAWCVRLVGRNEAEWIADLRVAFEHVENVRAQGPSSLRASGADATEDESSEGDSEE
ncbi:MAG TPA: hypothetical protein VHT30_03215 [Acidimicrobiales bacterium]|jgi:hypothetical protein|nr:hypothetical protein [Acidimicrobiales bacterium]